ncbi:MAG: flagellin [Pseudomonadota bacterium]
MSSILTNTSAMTALQTLRGINADLGKTQDMISTGKRVATAKDNAAIFAISKIMESDVAGFTAISESLSLGSSTIAVASNASNQVGDLLTEIKGKIVAANEGNVDRSTIQNEIDQLSDQIRGIVGGAQFNGLNLLSNGGENVDVLASLDRSADGGTTAAFITVNGRDFTENAGTYGSVGPISTTTISSSDPDAVTSQSTTLTLTNQAAFLTATEDTLTFTFGDTEISYVNESGGNQTDDDAAAGIAAAINSASIEGLSAVATGGGGSADSTVEITYTGTNLLSFGTNEADLTNGAVTGEPTSFAATSARTTADAVTESITIAGGATIAANATDEVTLTVGSESVTFELGSTPATINSEATLAEAVATAYNALAAEDQIEGVTIVNNGDTVEFTNNTTSAIDTFALDLSGVNVTAGTITATGSNTELGAATAAGAEYVIAGGTVNEGDSFRVSIDGTDYEYIAGINETVNDVAYGLQSVISASGPSDVQVTVNESTNSATESAALVINSSLGRTVTGADNTGGEGTGDLFGLSQIDVTTDEGARAALSNIESLIGTVNRAQADFGASERRVELQSDFMSSLIDSFKAGIGALVDTDMEAASARLQALQVLQQLGVLSLSSANPAPQPTFSLFRYGHSGGRIAAPAPPPL